MDIASLQAFVSVAETGSFSAASEELYLTQPAISKRIAVLESELDTSLFDRIGRQTSLTEAGRALLPRAQKILLEIEDSRRILQNLSNTVSGTLRFGTSHHIGLHRLPPVLRQYTHQYPQVDLDIQFMDSEEACRAVEHGDLELAVVTLPLYKSENLLTKCVWVDQLVVVTGKTHPLAKQRNQNLKLLAQHKAILPARGTFTREIIEQAFAKQKQTPDISMASNYLETIKMLVSVGLGWSILPEQMCGKELHQLNIPELKLKRELGLVWHGRRTLSNAAKELQNMLYRKT